MKKIEKILFISLLVAFFLKILYIPGNGIIFVITSLSLNLFYLAGSWYFLGIPYNKIKELIISIFIGITYSLSIISLLYRVQHWNDYQNLFYFTLITIPLTLLLLILIRKQLSKNILTLLIARGIIFLILNIVAFFI